MYMLLNIHFSTGSQPVKKVGKCIST
uniref:Uncharacterized protein n=1 Tax=Anguilla anguilla TaxID=7936 RepID=A0A0E9UX72_ANGAN